MSLSEYRRVSSLQIRMFEDELLLKRIKARFYTEQAEQRAFDIKRGTEKLCRHFGVVPGQGFGIRNDSPDIAAAGALLGYLEDTQSNALTHITRKVFENSTQRVYGYRRGDKAQP